MSKFLHIIKSCNFKTELVPVVFVDIINILEIAFNNLEIFKSFKFNFLLLDTFFKGKGDLLKNCSFQYLSNFLRRANKLELSVGLAGKVKQSQVPDLLKLKPKIIGFRSAVCKKNIRNDAISGKKLEKIHQLFKLDTS